MNVNKDMSIIFNLDNYIYIYRTDFYILFLYINININSIIFSNILKNKINKYYKIHIIYVHDVTLMM